MTAVAFLSLGAMGAAMAGHLARAGHAIGVWSRDRTKAERFVTAHGGRAADSPADAARGAAFVFACTGDDDALRAITLGGRSGEARFPRSEPKASGEVHRDGAFAGMAHGSVFVDHTTVSATVTRELAAIAAERGIAFVDAPVSGGQAGAEKGALSVMAGGDEDAFARVRPLLDSYARMARRLGPAGSGQLTKMVNQICIAGLVQSLAEALRFAAAAELDTAAVIEVISKGAAQSWQMENRHQTMAEGRFDFGFAVDWMRKDLGYALDEARRNGTSLPVVALVDQFYAEIQAMGGGRWDTSSLIARLK
jgi:3-hydroxyisobutyrate dehydrogenase